ncbi:hypothetical protein GCM10010466_51490 [Planomonospora alba]|uniref:Translation initiation factor IF-2 n=1 Tax=Planomonospora alba TaxID=161354 RepID=A0ABP6NNX4_9ACTN
MTTPPPGGRKRRRASARRAPAERPAAEQRPSGAEQGPAPGPAPAGHAFPEQPPAGWFAAGQPAAPPEHAGYAAPGERAFTGAPAAGPGFPGPGTAGSAFPGRPPATGPATEREPAGPEPAGPEPGGRSAGRRAARRSAKRDPGPSEAPGPSGTPGEEARETAGAGRAGKTPRSGKAGKARAGRRSDAPAGPEEEASIPWLAERGWSAARQRRLVVAASAVGALAALGAFVLTVQSIGGDYVPERAASSAVGTQPRPAVYRGWPSSKVFEPIAQRTADPRPLTVKEVFAEKTLKEGRITLRLADTGIDADCAAAVWGQALAERLAEAGCTQAVRGSYVSADRRHVAQYTLFNLRDKAAADGLVQSLASLHRGGWVRTLDSAQAVFPGADGHTEGSGHAMGHYAGLVWLARADGAEPGAQDDFVSLSLAVRGAEKAVFRRVVEAAPAP